MHFNELYLKQFVIKHFFTFVKIFRAPCVTLLRSLMGKKRCCLCLHNNSLNETFLPNLSVHRLKPQLTWLNGGWRKTESLQTNLVLLYNLFLIFSFLLWSNWVLNWVSRQRWRRKQDEEDKEWRDDVNWKNF